MKRTYAAVAAVVGVLLFVAFDVSRQNQATGTCSDSAYKTEAEGLRKRLANALF